MYTEDIIYRRDLTSQLTSEQADQNMDVLDAIANNHFLIKNVTILAADTLAQIVTKINALAAYQVDETQIPVFVCDASDNTAVRRVYVVNGMGRGNYGTGGTALVESDFLKIFDTQVTTRTSGDNTTFPASTAFVKAAIDALDLNIRFSKTYPKQTSPHTGTTNFTRVYVADISGSAFTNGALEIKFSWGATGTAGIKQFFGYLVKQSDYNDTYPLNSTNRLFTAPIDNSVASLIGAYGQRLATLSGTSLSIWPSGSPTLLPVSTAQAFTNLTFTPNANYKLIIACQLSNSADSAWVEALQITSIRTA